jgi:uncharacterized protein YoxC
VETLILVNNQFADLCINYIIQSLIIFIFCLEAVAYTTPRKIDTLRYAGDIKSPDVATPRRAKRSLDLAFNTIEKQRKKIKCLQDKNRRLLKKTKSLQDLVQHLKKKNLITEQAGANIMTSMPDAIQEIIQRNLQNRRLKYSAELRSFAITLQFYSAKAYNYIRKKFNNLLPCPSVIRKWFSVVNGHPGFTKEAFQAIQNRTKMSTVLVNIVIDEMAIRQQILYCQSRYYGYADFGVAGVDRTNDKLATSA